MLKQRIQDVPVVVVTACVLHNIRLVNNEIDDFLDDGDDANDSRDDNEMQRLCNISLLLIWSVKYITPLFHIVYWLSTIETFSIRFFMENRKPQNITRPRPRSHVCSLQFMFELWAGLLAVSDLRQGFLPLKIVQPRVYRQELAFYTHLGWVCWIFYLQSMNYSCFLGNKSDALRLDEKHHGSTKQWTRTGSSNWLYIPAVLT